MNINKSKSIVEEKRGFDLRRKIVSIFLVSFLLLISITTFLIAVFMDTRDKYDFFIDSVIEKKVLLKELDITLIDAQSKVRSFFIHLDQSVTDSAREDIMELNDIIDELYIKDQQIAYFRNDDFYLESAKEIKEKMKAYIGNFGNNLTIIFDLYIQKGLTDDTGLKGRFLANSRSFQNLVEQYSNDTVLVEFQKLRIYEKDYLQSKNLIYVTSYRKQVEVLKNSIGSADLSVSVISDMVNYIEKSRRGFEAIIEFDQDIDRATRELSSIINSIGSFLSMEISNMDLILEEENNLLDEHVKNMIKTAIIIGGIIVIAELFLLALIWLTISKPMKIIMRDTGRLEKGDLSQDILYEKNDEMGRISLFINGAVRAVRNLIFQAQIVSEQSIVLTSSIVATASESAAATTEINANINSINKKTTMLLEQADKTNDATVEIKGAIGRFRQSVQNQSASIEESTTAIEQMASTIQNVSQIAQDRGKAAEVLHKVTHNGEEQINITNNLINELSQITEDILNITKIINGIASQTNLLAMNAAIEAAHAGDVGRGFAVVADEIRKLAESSSVNASQINTLLKDAGARIQSASDASMGSIESFKEVKSEVSVFVRSLSEIAASMSEMSIGSKEILTSTSELTKSMSEISSETEEIVADVDEISESINSVNILTHETTNGISEIQLAIGEIDKSIVELNEKCIENEELMSKMDHSLKEFQV